MAEFSAWLWALFLTLLAAFVWSLLPDDDDDNNDNNDKMRPA